MEKLRAGIIGLGVGEAHIEGYREHPDCDVVAVCDFQKAPREKVKSKYTGLDIEEDSKKILERSDIDVVSIASYDDHHYEQIISALEHDKHIFVEKPICLTREHAIKIRQRLNKKPHLRLSSNLIMRRYPRFMELKRMIESNEMGKIFSIEGDYNYGRLEKITSGWRSEIDFYSIVCGGGVHIIDLFLWLQESKILEVMAYGNKITTENSAFKFNDFVNCLFKFNNGMIGKMSVNFGCVYPHFHRFSVYGTKQTFTHEPQGAFVYETRDPEQKPKKINLAYPGVKKGHLLYDFIESIQNNSKPIVSIDEVFNSMSVCFSIEESMKTQKPVVVDYL